MAKSALITLLKLMVLFFALLVVNHSIIIFALSSNYEIDLGILGLNKFPLIILVYLTMKG